MTETEPGAHLNTVYCYSVPNDGFPTETAAAAPGGPAGGWAHRKGRQHPRPRGPMGTPGPAGTSEPAAPPPPTPRASPRLPGPSSAFLSSWTPRGARFLTGSAFQSPSRPSARHRPRTQALPRLCEAKTTHSRSGPAVSGPEAEHSSCGRVAPRPQGGFRGRRESQCGLGCSARRTEPHPELTQNLPVRSALRPPPPGVADPATFTRRLLAFLTGNGL